MLHVRVFKQTCVNVWACHTPFAPELCCCVDSDWQRRVWKSTSVELQGGRPLVLPLPCFSGFQLGISASFNFLFANLEEASRLSTLSVFYGQIFKLTCRHVVCTIAACNTQPLSLRPCYWWKNVHQLWSKVSVAVVPVNLSPPSQC